MIIRRSIVFVGPADSTFVNPTNATSYTANALYSSAAAISGSAFKCVYNRSGNSVAVTGMSSATNYKIYVLEYNGVKGLADETIM
jgi:hypothetical protein